MWNAAERTPGHNLKEKAANYVYLSACKQLRTLSIHLVNHFRQDASAWGLLFTIRSQYLAEINIVLEHIQGLIFLPSKSE